MAQMEQWSVLGNVLNYIQYDKHPRNYITCINAVNKYKNSFDAGKERDVVELDFWCHTKNIMRRISRCV